MSEKDLKANCDTDGYCDPMLERLGELNNPRKGFAALMLMDKKLDVTVTTPVYYMGGKDKGAFINYCPWCGTEMALIREAWSKKPIENMRTGKYNYDN